MYLGCDSIRWVAPPIWVYLIPFDTKLAKIICIDSGCEKTVVSEWGIVKRILFLMANGLNSCSVRSSIV
jgi:hypothetical protein